MSDPIVPLPHLQANVGIYQIALSWLFGLVMGRLMKPLATAWHLWRKYPNVKGCYSVQREDAAGRLEACPGEIVIKPKWTKGFFAITAFHKNGAKDWESKMYLSLDIPDTGQGYYRHSDKEAGQGSQVFLYTPGIKQFSVRGVTFKPNALGDFYHRWTKEE